MERKETIMAEQTVKNPKSKARIILGKAVTFLLTLLLIGAVYVAAVLLQSPGDNETASYVVQEEKEPVTRMQSATVNSAQQLASLFGAPLPALPGYAVTGRGGNTSHDGETVRIASLQYSGLTVTAVRPASAAPLLLKSDLSVSMRGDLTLLNLPAMLANKGSAFCLYASSEDAAYAIYAPNAQEEDFMALLGAFQWAE